MAEYQERFVAFIDVLGFSNLVEKSNNDPNLLNRLVSVLNDVKMYGQISEPMNNTPGDTFGFFQDMYRMTTFSDSIVISTKNNPIGLGLLVSIVSIMCNRLLHQGIITRGGISKGNMIHDENIVIGDGLIKAYKLESTTAIYPRIIIDDCVLTDFIMMERQSSASIEYRKKDQDGLWFLHILDQHLLAMGSQTTHSEYNNLNHPYMALARNAIVDGLTQAHSLNVRSKLYWLAEYFNKYIDVIDIEPINLEHITSLKNV